jgi:hydrogenase maturation factor HypF (carbamoyltransferase family)
MINSQQREVENARVRVRCPECRSHFHERVQRIAFGERVVCPSCRCEMRFYGVGHMHEHESVAAYLHHVEERTNHPHYSRD